MRRGAKWRFHSIETVALGATPTQAVPLRGEGLGGGGHGCFGSCEGEMVEPKPQFEVSKSLVEHIKDQITQGILQANFKPGQQMIEGGPPEQQGFLVNVARKGMYVRKIMERDIQNHFPIGANLEGLAARLATPFLTQKISNRCNPPYQ